MPGDDNEPPSIPQQQDRPTQNPSSPLQTLESTDPDPPNQDPDRNHLQDGPNEHEGMPINVEEKETEIEALPPSSSSRRAASRRKKGSVNNHPRTLAAIEKKVQVLTQKWKVIPFVRNKALDFSRHEENLRRLGLWEFAHLEFDRKLRPDLLAKLILTFNPKDRSSSVDGVKVRVAQVDLAKALSLWKKPKLPASDDEEVEEEVAWPADFLAFLDEFVSNWMLLHEDTWILPKEVVNLTKLIKEGHPEKVNWTKLIWFMVRRELSMGVELENCYYASHLQQLIRFQRNELLKEDEDEEGDVKMRECVEVSHDREPENVQQSVQSEETVVNLGAVGNASDAENVGSGDITTGCVGGVENPDTADGLVENPEKPIERVESPEKAVEHLEGPETAVDHQETVGDHANTDGHVDKLETATGHVDELQKLEAAVYLVTKPETTGDLVQNMNAVKDYAESLKINAGDVEDGNAAKREVEHDPEIPGHSLNDSHKRMRTEGPSC